MLIEGSIPVPSSDLDSDQMKTSYQLDFIYSLIIKVNSEFSVEQSLDSLTSITYTQNTIKGALYCFYNRFLDSIS